MSEFDYKLMENLSEAERAEVEEEVRNADRKEEERQARLAADRREAKEAFADLDAADMRGETWADRKARIAATIVAERRAKGASNSQGDQG